MEGFDGTEEVVIEKSEVEVFDISPSGDIFVEVENNEIGLTNAEDWINIKEPYSIEGLTIKQFDDVIVLESEEQLAYFKVLVQGLLNAAPN